MSINLETLDKQILGFFRFKKLKGQYLLTNDVGGFCFLDEPVFNDFIAGDFSRMKLADHLSLKQNGFIRNELDFNGLIKKFNEKNRFLGIGPGLHIIVVTLRCNNRCIYCQAGSAGIAANDNTDMTLDTAQNVVDRIFESSNPAINIEFQGGEPLLNYKTIAFIIDYAEKKNLKSRKKLMFSLVTNLSLMSDDKLKYFFKHKVTLCTSLDGPQKIHDKQRVAIGKNSYKKTITWIKKISYLSKEKQREYGFRINALATVTKNCLEHPKEIIDEYVKLGLDGIFLRPVMPYGMSRLNINKITCSADDFLKFYRKSFYYIINELNLKGINFFEATAKIFLRKIFDNLDPNFLDTRSPCGAGIGQVAFNYDGDIYTCDEGRMISATKSDASFKLGNVRTHSLKDALESDVVNSLCLASFTDNIPGCHECVYKPYCGVCPLYNYFVEKDIFGRENDRCKINKGILDLIFESLNDKKTEAVLKKWRGENETKKL